MAAVRPRRRFHNRGGRMSDADPITSYLAALRHRLRWRRGGARLLAEVEDHLAQLVRDEQAGGAPVGEAQQRALARFGSASSFAPRRRWAWAVGAAAGIAGVALVLTTIATSGQRASHQSSLHAATGTLTGPTNGARSKSSPSFRSAPTDRRVSATSRPPHPIPPPHAPRARWQPTACQEPDPYPGQQDAPPPPPQFCNP